MDRQMDKQMDGQTDEKTDEQTDTFIHDGGLGHFDEECSVVGTLGVSVKGGDLRAFLGPHFDSPITTGRHDAAIL